jgi:hypothetical protein
VSIRAVVDYCTILGAKRDYIAALQRLRELSAAPVGVIGEEGRWEKLVLRGKNGTLTLNSMEHEGAGDRLSQLRLGLHDFFWNVETTAADRKRTVLEAIASCALAIGVVAEPAFDEAERHFDCVLNVAKAVDGVIFNGVAMLDCDGRLVLDQDGKTDVSY